MKDGLHPDIPDAEYHSDRDALSSTGARLLLPPSTPAHFKQWRDNPPPPKREYSVGHVAHRLVLGKGAEICAIDAPDYRTKDARAARDNAIANDQAPVLAHEYAECCLMAEAVLTHPAAGPIFTNPKGDAEVSFCATDPETGVRLRSRVDWMHYGDRSGRLWLVDFKTSTTSDPIEFARKAFAFGYHVQAAFYLNVIHTLKLADNPRFVFVVVEKQPPYLVSVVEYDMPSIAEGHRQVRQAIDIYDRCTKRGQWPGYDDDITPISLPAWAIEQEIMI